MLIGLRGEVLFSDMKSPTGFPSLGSSAATYGQIQAEAATQGSVARRAVCDSGPFGVHTGMNVRFRFHRNFGFILSPEFDVMLPDFLFNADFSGGVEAAF